MKVITSVMCVMVLMLYACLPTEKSLHDKRAVSGSSSDLKSRERAAVIVRDVCQVCHDPASSMEDRLAPPLELIKRNYLDLTQSEEAFVTKMSRFILLPTEEEAEMHADIERYGLMDPVGYSREDIQAIARYIYSTDLAYPDWVDQSGN